MLTRTELAELKSGVDKNLEFDKNELQKVEHLKLTSNIQDLKSINCFIVTVADTY